MTYKIIRHYKHNAHFRHFNKRTIRTGLTLEEAQEHCNDPETSSRTCTKTGNDRPIAEAGDWFDGYTAE